MVISCTTDICEIKTKSSALTLRLGEASDAGSLLKINDIELPGPGEYEVGEIFTEISPRLAHFHMEDMVVVVYYQSLGEVTSEDLGMLERVDVLLLLPRTQAKEDIELLLKLATKVEPRVVLLVGAGEDVASQIAGQAPESVSSLKLTPKDLPEEGQRFYVLNR